MKSTHVYSKTGKGVMLLKDGRSRLPELETTILRLVDGSATINDLMQTIPVPRVQFQQSVAALIKEGFIRGVNSSAVGSRPISDSSVPVEDNDLDFTHLI